MTEWEPDLRWPALCGLHSEQGEHGGRHVVVVELLLGPLPGQHSGWPGGPSLPLEKLSLALPGRGLNTSC